MTTSVREQILARMAALLTGTTPAGANVFRSREVSITRAVSPAIVVMPDAEEDSAFSQLTDHHRLDVGVVIFTRGDPWDSLADPIALAAHQLICTDVTLRALAVGDIRKHSSLWNAEEADRTAGSLVMKYRITYLTQATDISAGAN